MSKSLLIGITGGSGSGKTYLLELLKASFSTLDMCIISQDNYYKPIEEQLADENGVENFDLTESMDHEAFFKDLSALKSGKSIQRNEYLFNNKNIVPKVLTFTSAPIIIAEGIFVFHHPEVFKMLDYKVFVESHKEIMLKRRIQRDAIERGYDLKDVNYRYEHHVLPAFDAHIEPHKHQADLVIKNNGLSEPEGLDELIHHINEFKT